MGICLALSLLTSLVSDSGLVVEILRSDYCSIWRSDSLDSSYSIVISLCPFNLIAIPVRVRPFYHSTEPVIDLLGSDVPTISLILTSLDSPAESIIFSLALEIVGEVITKAVQIA